MKLMEGQDVMDSNLAQGVSHWSKIARMELRQIRELTLYRKGT
jgi:hypothetical protein